MDFKARTKEKRLKLAGKRNQRGLNSQGEFVELDKYDKLVMESPVV
jgi:hypothetical protein